MELGASIARRFTLVREEDYDIDDIQRFVARDSRLGTEVTVDICASHHPTAVVRAANVARGVGDRRLARVLAAGTQTIGEETFAYVAAERQGGLRMDELLGVVALLPETASSLVAQATAALQAASAAGQHHGMIRPRALTVTERGRVIVSGLGVDREFASQAGIKVSSSERADAAALARLYLSAVTGKADDDVEPDDVPSDLTPAAVRLCEEILAGREPRALKDLAAALGTAQTAPLRLMVEQAPALWWPPPPLLAAPVADAPATPRVLAVEEPALTLADLVDDDVVTAELVTGEVEPFTYDAALADSVIEGEVVPLDEPRPRARTRFGGAVDDIDEFHDIVAAQNAVEKPTVVESILEGLHRRFPGSPALARMAAAAHERAQVSAPINPGPLLVALGLTAVFIAIMVAVANISAPFDPDYERYNNPKNTYPDFTVGVSSAPTDGAAG